MAQPQSALLTALEAVAQKTREPDNWRLVVAFSGGGDSTALLWGLRQLTAPAGSDVLVAAHLDHGLDQGSADRLLQARKLAQELGVEMISARLPVAARRHPGESLEAASRRVRYEFLEAVRRERGAARIVTAHHLDDQLETLLLRLLRGTGLRGLAGIRAEHGHVVRPLLDLRREELASALVEAGIEAISDPTNLDLRALRNQIRLRLPRLLTEDPNLAHHAGRLASRALAASQALDQRLARLLDLEPASVSPGASPGARSTRSGSCGSHISLRRLTSLAVELRPWALALLHQRAGAAYPPRKRAQRQLFHQLERGNRLDCDAGAGWRWRLQGDRLFVVRGTAAAASFPYTVEIPGVL